MVRRLETLPAFGVTDLNGAINNSTTSVTVDSGSVFPVDGDYRVKCEDEVMLVTDRATNVLTVIRGVDDSTAASHGDGAQIAAVGTRDNLATWTNDLGCGGRGGAENIGEELPRGIWNNTTQSRLTASDFTWVNQGSATLTDSGDGLYLAAPTTNDNASNNRIAVVTAPSTPWTLDVLFFINYGCTFDGWDWFALCARESGTGEFYSFRALPWSGKSIQHNNSPTSINTTVSAVDDITRAYLWYRITDDGTNIHFRHSTNSLNFYRILQEGSTSRLAAGADQIGFLINAGTTGGETFGVHISSLNIS
jgi:hypothetical protein